MREIVIVISDLYFPARETGLATEPERASAEGASGTLPGFEHAARFGQKRVIEGGWRPWLARWLGRNDLADVAPAVIAAAALSTITGTPAGAENDSPAYPGATAAKLPSDSSAWIATPAHLIAGLTSLHLDRRSILRLPIADLESLAKDFNHVFVDADLSLTPLSSGDFLLQGPGTLTGSTTEPARALVADLEAALPKGSNARSLKRLGAELEMWLHASPLNETRQRAGQLPVSTLWLWGGGPRSTASAHRAPLLDPPSNTRADVAFGTDPYLAGLWHLRGGSQIRALPDQLNSQPGQPDAQRTLLVTEVTPLLQKNPHCSVLEALADLDRRFLTPALAALRQGDIESVVILANDIEVRLRRHDRLKLWRRRQSALMGLQP
jgi:hypothetical protein